MNQVIVMTAYPVINKRLVLHFYIIIIIIILFYYYYFQSFNDDTLMDLSRWKYISELSSWLYQVFLIAVFFNILSTLCPLLHGFYRRTFWIVMSFFVGLLRGLRPQNPPTRSPSYCTSHWHSR